MADDVLQEIRDDVRRHGGPAYAATLCDALDAAEAAKGQLRRELAQALEALQALQYGPPWDRCWCLRSREHRTDHTEACKLAQRVIPLVPYGGF